MEKILLTDNVEVTAKGIEIEVTDDLIDKVLKVARRNGKADSRFDINLLEGEIAERTFAELLNEKDGLSIELKRDFMISKTGNVAVETACNNKPSGISATKAKWWVYFLEGNKYNGEVFVGIKTERLKRIIKNARQVNGGDRNASVLRLIKVEELLKKDAQM